ncbi:hypothetical protein [Tomitella gaofuii]|uniref:hypothetical protein n=1 Tax=Tomitella gaofuii TaxID=2760083 RepID=UPI0015F88A9D|nr:hypothetical protein [Tomitella gaofuii]
MIVGDPFWSAEVRTGLKYRHLESDWNYDLSEETTGRLCWVTGRGYRWLDCRVEKATDPKGTTDPARHGVGRYSYVLASDEAFYSGFPARYTVASRADEKVKGRVWNVGDYEAFPILRVHGPAQWVLDAGRGEIVLPEIRDGDWWDIDTDPDVLTVTDSQGVNRRDVFNSEWATGPDSGGLSVNALSVPVPPGEPVEVKATPVGRPPIGKDRARVEAVIHPRYRRAW